MTDDCTRKPTRLVLLDRDGVVNFDSSEYIKSPAEWRPIPGSLAAIAALNAANIHTALCSNQAGIGRGLLSANSLAAIHARFDRELAIHDGHIDLWRYCPHSPTALCDCRKPRAAMLEDCMDEFQVAPCATVFVGDSITDMQAAIKAGCLGILVRTHQGSENSSARDREARELGITLIADDLAQAVEFISRLNSQHDSVRTLP